MVAKKEIAKEGREAGQREGKHSEIEHGEPLPCRAGRASTLANATIVGDHTIKIREGLRARSIKNV